MCYNDKVVWFSKWVTIAYSDGSELIVDHIWRIMDIAMSDEHLYISMYYGDEMKTRNEDWNLWSLYSIAKTTIRGRRKGISYIAMSDRFISVKIKIDLYSRDET